VQQRNKVQKNTKHNSKVKLIREGVSNEVGQFNMFELQAIDPKLHKPLPYKRRDYYKIMWVVGPMQFTYADKEIVLKKQALVFSNPQIPYVCENLQDIEGGRYCIFSKQFFESLGNTEIYSVFQPTGNHIFELTIAQSKKIASIFNEMLQDFKSEYVYKQDLIKNHVISLLHFGLKMQPNDQLAQDAIGASKRIAGLFMELLERQFPIEETHPCISYRSPSEFAKQLNIHVNHLNRAVRETTGKTTTTLIAERILKEAQILLKRSSLNVSEIAYALGFKESTHFNNFFKKQMGISPLVYRKK
jgi:AraC-like DNA-binding protein